MREAMTHPQVVLVGAQISRHDSWEEAVEHVCTALGCHRDATWFRYSRGGMALFDTTRPWPERQHPIARILNPVEYQAAKSRGDLADNAAADLYFRRAEASNFDPAHTQTNTMKKPANDPKAKPEKITYFVTDKAPEGRMMIAAKVVRTGQCVDVLPIHAETAGFKRWIAQGWVRVATDEERNAPPPKPPGDPTDRREVSVAIPNQGAAVQVQMVALAKIRPDPTQPRKEFAPESMQELVDSIKVQGVEQAILVRPMSRWRQIVSFVARQWVRVERKELCRELVSTDLWGAGIETTAKEMLDAGGFMGRLVAEGRIQRNGTNGAGMGFVPLAGALAPPTGDRSLAGESEWLEIVYGERRWRAAQAAGLTEIPAKVRELTDIEAAEKQAIENLDRDDLKPLEEAHGYRKLLDQPGYTMARLVETTGKPKNTIYGKLKLLELPDEVRKAVDEGKLPAVTAERIARLDEGVQAKAVKEILHPSGWQAQRGQVLTDRAAKEKIEELKKEQAQAEKRQAVEDTAKAEGFHVLTGKEAYEVAPYGDVLDNRGYVKAGDVCPRDPKGRSWQKIVASKEAASLTKPVNVRKIAVVVERYQSEPKAAPIFDREEVNALLKALGMWEVEGSKVAEEKAKKQKERAEKVRAAEKMAADVEAITDHARRPACATRALLAAVWALTDGYEGNIDVVAQRHGWIAKDDRTADATDVVRRIATDMNAGDLQALVVELAIFGMGADYDFYADAREEMREVLEMDGGRAGEPAAKASASARTDLETAEAAA